MLLSLLRGKSAVRLACLLPAAASYHSCSALSLRLVGSFVGHSPFVKTHRTSSDPVSRLSRAKNNSGRIMASMTAAPGGSAGIANTSGDRKTGIVWFKHTDLRVTDHEPLAQAHRDCSHVAHVFCIDDRWFGSTKHGTNRMSPSRCRFLLESVKDLQARLRSKGSDLLVKRGHPEAVIPDLAKELVGGEGSTPSMPAKLTLYAHTDVCSEEADVHSAVKKALSQVQGGGSGGGSGKRGVTVKEVWGNTLHRLSDLPFDLPHGVPEIFTQFRKSVEQKSQMRPPVPTPSGLRPLPTTEDGNTARTEVPTTEQLGVGAAPERDAAMAVLPFEGGETAAMKRVRQYIWDEDRLKEYKKTRNGLLGSGFSSKFSPWLALGCISPTTVVAEIRKYERERVANDSTYWLIFELLWRDFFRYSAVKNGNSIFHLGGPRHDAGKQAWSSSELLLEAWKDGMTGYPFVDANMRELKASGFMSNRGRQVVASFFTKDLAMDWRLGAEHFEEHLLDHDPASNWGNWNYVAGVGSDPREDRYFNIEKQAKTYDGEGEYMRHWIPEVAALPTTALQSPGGITTMLRHMHAIPASVYPDPIAPLKKFSASGGRGGGRSGGGGGRGGNSGKRGGRGSGKGGNRKFKSSRIQRDGAF